MADDKTFVLYKDLGPKFSKLSREEKGAILEAIFAFENGEDVPEDMPIGAAIAWDFLLPMLQAAQDKGNEISEARTNAANTRWANERAKKEAEAMQSDASAMQTDANIMQNDANTMQSDASTMQTDAKEKEKDKDIKENLTPNGVSQKKTAKALSFADASAEAEKQGFSEDVCDAVKLWLQYKHERKDNYKPAGLTGLFAQVRKHVETHGSELVIDSIKDSIASNYKGIIWENIRGTPKKQMPNVFESCAKAERLGFGKL
jgi:hypothetical protein